MSTSLTWFNDSPDVGPECLCSVCGKPILDPDVAIRQIDWHLDKEARFHIACWNRTYPGAKIASVSRHDFDLYS